MNRTYDYNDAERIAWSWLVRCGTSLTFTIRTDAGPKSVDVRVGTGATTDPLMLAGMRCCCDAAEVWRECFSPEDGSFEDNLASAIAELKDKLSEGVSQ